MQWPSLDQCREFLKDTIRQKIDFSQTDQYQGASAATPGKTLPGRRRAARSAAGRPVARYRVGRSGNRHRCPPEPTQFQPRAADAGRAVYAAVGHAGRAQRG